MGSTRRDHRVIYLRVRPERHTAIHAYAARRGYSVTELTDWLFNRVLDEAAATPALRKMHERLERLEEEVL